MSKIKKFGIIALTVVTAVGMSGLPANAQTADELQAQIQSLLAQIEALQAQLNASGGSTTGGGVAVSCDFTRNLYPEMSGSDVKCLQQYLNAAGYTVADSGAGSPGNETEYYGSLTKAAVTKWQDANGVAYGNWAGYFGPSSQAKYDELAASAPAEGSEGDSGVVTPDSGVSVSVEVMDDVTAPKNATMIELGEFTFAAGEDVTIEGLDFEREGAGVRGDWDKLYVYEDGTRLTSGRTINTNQELTFTNLDVDVDDGEAVTLTLKGTLSSSNAGNVHYFDLVSVELDDEDVEVDGLPLSTREITISNVDTGTIDVDRNTVASSNVNIGDEEVEIFNADISADSEDIEFEEILLTQYGSVTMEDLDNYYIEIDGDKVDADIDVDGDEISIELDDTYLIEDGKNITLALFVDMSADAYIKGGTGTIDLNVDETNDVFATGQDYGYGANVTVNDGTGNLASDQVTLKASELTFSFVGPQTGDIGLSDEDAVLFEAKATVLADYEVTGLTFKFDFGGGGSSAETHLDNLKLVNADTGETYGGPDEITATSSSAYYHEFDDVFILEQGSYNLQVVADVGTNTDNDGNVTVTMIVDDGTSSHDLAAENLETSEDIDITTDVVPAGTIAGKQQTFTQPNLTIANSPTPSAQTYVVGRSNTVLGAYVLEASNVSDIEVRQLQFNFSVASSTAAALSSSLTLYKDSVESGNEIDSTSVDSGSAADSVSFDTSNELDITAGEQVTVYLVGDLKSDFDSGYLTGTNTDNATTSLTSVTAKDDENNDPLFNSAASLTAVDGSTFAIAGSGSFSSVAFGGNNPSENTVIVPGNDILFQSYRLRPQNEDVQMRDFVLSIADYDEVSYFSNIFVKVDGVEKSGKTITTTTKVFEDYNFELEKDVDTTVDVMADLVSSGFGVNLTSGAELQLYFATTTTNYDIVGLDSGSAVTFTTTSIDTEAEGLRTYQVANSYPTFDYTGSDATLVAGTRNLYNFTVTANEDDVYLRDISFQVQVEESTTTTSDLQVGTFQLLKNGSVVGTATTTDADPNGIIGDSLASETATTTISISNVSEYTIGAGTTATFVLRGNVSGVASDDANSISVSMDNADESGTYDSADTAAGVTGNTVWGDTYKYFDGYYLDHPTDSQTLSL